MDNEPKNNKRKVLCIEDEYFISELYERALTKNGYDIKIVNNGIDALKEAQTDQYDIILLDIMIPGITGTEVLKQLRDPSKTPHLKAKIIITTNLEQREEVKENIEKQADAYVVKASLTPNELVEFIDNIR